ncbi:MAG: hypothetical protein ACPG32_13060 [Akkermansiaceae bacterium]
MKTTCSLVKVTLPLLAAVIYSSLVGAGPVEPPKQPLKAWMDDALNGKMGDIRDVTITKDRVEAERKELWSAYRAAATRAKWNEELLPVPPTIDALRKEGKKLQLKAGKLTSGELTMPYVLMAKGEKPATGWPMFICLHGGGKFYGKGETTAHGWSVNSREWQAQMKLTAAVYKPTGLYFIPRMADDRLGRWWHKHNIDIFTRAIRNAILFNDVDPNKIYIMGISQGGYGSCHLAPFMADLFAAAGPMAGGMMTVTENLRNLPFRSDIGEKDTAYKRIDLAKALHKKIDEHKAADPAGYKNVLAIQKGRGHGIDYSLSPTWLAENTRNPYPEKIVWRCHQKHGIYRDSFYWISLKKTPEKGEFSITATLDKEKNQVEITATQIIPTAEKGQKLTRKPLDAKNIRVHLNDSMLNLDGEIAVVINGKETFRGNVTRSRNAMMKSLVKRGDANYAFPVIINQ